jgi:hypothetical protein
MILRAAAAQEFDDRAVLRISVLTSCIGWCHYSERVTPQVTPGKPTRKRLSRKLVCSKEFRGVAQW